MELVLVKKFIAKNLGIGIGKFLVQKKIPVLVSKIFGTGKKSVLFDILGTTQRKIQGQRQSFQEESLPVYMNLVFLRSNRYIWTRVIWHDI